MVRIRIHLSDARATALRRLAADRGVSMSEIVRQSIDAFVAKAGGIAPDEVRRSALSAIGILAGGPRDLSVRHDDYAAEAWEH